MKVKKTKKLSDNSQLNKRPPHVSSLLSCVKGLGSGNIPFLKNGSGGLGPEHTSVVCTASFYPESWGQDQKGPWTHSPSALTVDVMEDQRISKQGNEHETEAGPSSMKAETGCMCEWWHQTTHNPTQQVRPQQVCLSSDTGSFPLFSSLLFHSAKLDLPGLLLQQSRACSIPQCSYMEYKAPGHACLLQRWIHTTTILKPPWLLLI